MCSFFVAIGYTTSMNTLKCLGCQEELFDQGFLCEQCFEELVKIQSLEKFIHNNVLVYTVFFYTGIVEKLIHQMKFNGRPALCQFLASFMVEFIKKNHLEPKSVSYIPMHYLKRWMRGFDPGYLLAHTLSKELGIPLVKALKRVRGTKSLYRLKPKEREQTLKGCFMIQEPYEGPLVIIDDIFTTGSTVSEAASTLLEGDQETFFCLVLSKAWKKM